jgi:hypothetical protein
LKAFLLDPFHIYLSMALGRFSSFLILFTVGRTPGTGSQSVPSQLPTHRTTQSQNKRTQTSMPWVGFEAAHPAFERAKTVHALDRAATVIGTPSIYPSKIHHTNFPLWYKSRKTSAEVGGAPDFCRVKLLSLQITRCTFKLGQTVIWKSFSHHSFLFSSLTCSELSRIYLKLRILISYQFPSVYDFTWIFHSSVPLTVC